MIEYNFFFNTQRTLIIQNDSRRWVWAFGFEPRADSSSRVQTTERITDKSYIAICCWTGRGIGTIPGTSKDKPGEGCHAAGDETGLRDLVLKAYEVNIFIFTIFLLCSINLLGHWVINLKLYFAITNLIKQCFSYLLHVSFSFNS